MVNSGNEKGTSFYLFILFFLLLLDLLSVIVDIGIFCNMAVDVIISVLKLKKEEMTLEWSMRVFYFLQ